MNMGLTEPGRTFAQSGLLKRGRRGGGGGGVCAGDSSSGPTQATRVLSRTQTTKFNRGV